MSRSSRPAAPAGPRVGALVGAGMVACCLVTGCAGLTGSGAPTSTQPTDAPDDRDGSAVVLRVEDLGGYTSYDNRVYRLPGISVHADGRAIRHLFSTPTSVDDEPALPVLVQRTLTPAGMDALVERVRDAGVGDCTDLSDALVVDASTTRFLLVTEEGREQSDANALRESAGLTVAIGEPTPSPSIPVGRGSVDGTFSQEQADARYRLLDLSDALEDLPATLGADAVGEETPYVPEAVAVLATPWGDEPIVDPIAWPGPTLTGETMSRQTDATCTVVRGGDVAPVLDAVGRAVWWSPWTDGGSTWSVRFRPLLPDERGCADLVPQG